MATWTWIIIGIAAAAIGLVALYAMGAIGRRKVERRRAEAHVLRQEADERTRRAEEREAVASRIAEEAHEEREQARKLEQRAGKLDPTKARTELADDAEVEETPPRRAVLR